MGTTAVMLKATWKYKAVQRFVAFSQDFLMYLKVTYAQQGWIYFMKNTEIMKQNYEKKQNYETILQFKITNSY